MEKHRVNFETGDSVKVKSGIMDPDVEDLCIEGWQGRVAEITDGGTTILIRWDSVTLENMSREYIDLGEEQGWDYTRMYLEPQDVEVAKARDSEEEVAAVLERISESLSWSWLGEDGKRVQEVLAGVDEEDTMELLRAWEKYLSNCLGFPFDAEVSEYHEREPLQAGDKVRVQKISKVHDLYGLIVELRRQRDECTFPLCDLEVLDKDSPNYQHVKDYSIWFANR